MYKLLIVDDDLLARMGMKMLIDWQTYRFEVIGTADSGEQALEMMEKELPHVVFTDVVMHGMDGVELTRQIKARYPGVLVVALSCYTDVDYVKNIIRMGAEDYLQKLSMRPEDVVTMLQKLTVKLEAAAGHGAISETEKRREATLLGFIRGESGIDTAALGVDIGTSMRFMVIRKIVETASAAQWMERVAQALQNLKICWGHYREDLLAALVPDDTVETLAHLAQQILTRAHLPGEGAEALSGPVCVGFSQPFEGTQETHKHFCRAGEASLAAYLNYRERVFFYCEESETELAALYAQQERMNRLLEEGDLAGVIAQASELTRCMKALVSQSLLCRQMYTSLFSHLTRLEVMQGMKPEIPGFSVEKMERVEESQQLFENRVMALSARLSRSPERYRREIRLAIEYMQAHYQENVTLARVAAHVAMSESHLSSVFKKETGKGLVSYLEEIRIAHAVRLMAAGREPMYAVAQKVGYYNVNYFSRVFKKVRGETPSAFLKRQKIMR